MAVRGQVRFALTRALPFCAGENTLNAQCARLLMQTVAENGHYDRADFLESYVDFMVTPGTHNDTFAGMRHLWDM
jgi:hypothetical protein